VTEALVSVCVSVCLCVCPSVCQCMSSCVCPLRVYIHEARVASSRRE